MDQPGTGSGIIGHEIEIIAVRACGFRLLLRVEAFRKPPATFRLLRLDFHRPAESCLRFATFSVAKCSPAQVIDRRDVVGIEMEQSFEGFGSAGAVTRTVQRDGQEISGMALRRKQLHGLPKRRYRGGRPWSCFRRRAIPDISWPSRWTVRVTAPALPNPSKLCSISIPTTSRRSITWAGLLFATENPAKRKQDSGGLWKSSRRSLAAAGGLRKASTRRKSPKPLARTAIISNSCPMILRLALGSSIFSSNRKKTMPPSLN